MKICFLGDARSIHSVRWVNSLSEKGHEVHLISINTERQPGEYAQSVHFHTLTNPIVPESTSSPAMRGMGWALTLIAWAIQTRRILAEVEPDLLDAHYVTGWGYVGAMSGFHPLVLSTWGSDVLRDPMANPVVRGMTRLALALADAVVCDSQTAEKALISLGVRRRKIRLAYWGVDTRLFSPVSRDDRSKRTRGLSGNLLVTSLRNFYPIYDVQTLVRAIPFVVAEVPSTMFLLAGKGPEETSLRTLAERLGVATKIRWLGWINHDELATSLSISDVYVSTALSDSTSVSLQEAMACEVPPVVTDIPANREWIRDGVEGFLVPAQNPAALARCIVRLLKSEKLRGEFGLRARQVICSRADLLREVQRRQTIYQDVVGALRRPQTDRPPRIGQHD